MGQPQEFRARENLPEKGVARAGEEVVARHARIQERSGGATIQEKRRCGIAASYLGHVMIQNRNGLVVAACATQLSTKAEREAALANVQQRGRTPGEVKKKRLPAITLGADKLYQEKKFIAALRRRRVIQHVAEYQGNAHWPNWLTKKERQNAGMAISQRKRKLVEKVFGW